MSPSAFSSSPPVLPIPRHPSPLSFSVSAQDPPSPPIPTTPQHVIIRPTPPDPTAGPSRFPEGTSSRTYAPVSPSFSPPSPARSEKLVPTQPLPDSLLCRSTFAALEHSAITFKRVSKSVLASTAVYLALLEQVERAEDDFLGSLGELGRWLESGYGLTGSIWEPEDGIKKMRKQQRRKEREEVEVIVDHSLKAAKAELKRNGLAGGGAQARFEVRLKRCTLRGLSRPMTNAEHCQAILSPDFSLPIPSTLYLNVYILPRLNRTFHPPGDQLNLLRILIIISSSRLKSSPTGLQIGSFGQGACFTACTIRSRSV